MHQFVGLFQKHFPVVFDCPHAVNFVLNVASRVAGLTIFNILSNALLCKARDSLSAIAKCGSEYEIRTAICI
jgi:hypothetical protein